MTFATMLNYHQTMHIGGYSRVVPRQRRLRSVKQNAPSP